MDRLLEYVNNHPWLVAATALMALVVIVSEWRTRTQSFAAVSPNEAVRLMNQGAALVDVRPTAQFKEGHIAGARNVPGPEIADGAKSLEKWREKVVITCCDNGMTAGSAARQLGRLGFKQVVNLRGGLAAWRAENLPVVKG